MNFLIRLVAATAGTRAAAAAGRYGIVGTGMGLLVTSAVLRWPGKALLLGAGLGLRRIWLQQSKPVALLEHRPIAQDTVPLTQRQTQESLA